MLAAGAMENRFTAAADALAAYIREGAPQTHGAAEFAILHLVSRSLSDLRWGQLLASSGYPIQMYSVIRPVPEALNLIDLFVDDPVAAERWANGEWREFLPVRVRERLGIEEDALYSFMSEHSHPRFAGLQLSVFRRVGGEEGEGQQAILFMGEIPFDVPAVLLATAMPGALLAQLALAAGHVRLARVAALGWAGVIRRTAVELAEGWREVAAQLPEAENDEGEIIEPLRHIQEIAAELEAAAAEAEAAIAEGEGRV